MAAQSNDFDGQYGYHAGLGDLPNGAAAYQQNGQNANDTSSQLFQALLKQSMQQQGSSGNGMSAIIPGLMAMFQSMGGSNTDWSPGVANSTYSMGGGD